MADGWQEAADWWRQDVVQHVTGEALKVLAVLVVGWLALRYLVAPLGRLLERGRVDPSTASFLVNTARAVILAGVLLAVLQGLGVPTASLLALLTARDDLAAVREALRARLAADPRILADPAPQLFVQEWAEDKRVLAVQAWTATANYPVVQQELLETLGTHLDGLRRPPA